MTKFRNMINAFVLSPLFATSALADPSGSAGYSGHMWGGGHGWYSMGGGAMILFWIAIIVLIVLALRWILDRDDGDKKSSSAMDILKERLARGEIEPAEYEERRKVLEK